MTQSTCCKWGHEFTEENTYWRKEGQRQCKACSKWRKQQAKVDDS